MQGEHLLGAAIGIGAYEALLDLGPPEVHLIQVDLVPVRLVARRGMVGVAGQDARGRPGVAQEVLADETQVAGPRLFVNVPLPGVAAVVACALQVVVDPFDSFLQAEPIGRDAVLVRVDAGVERRPGRGADGRGCEGVVEADAAGGEAVDMGGATDVIEAVGADRVAALLVAHKDKDVARAGGHRELQSKRWQKANGRRQMAKGNCVRSLGMIGWLNGGVNRFGREPRGSDPHHYERRPPDSGFARWVCIEYLLRPTHTRPTDCDQEDTR